MAKRRRNNVSNRLSDFTQLVPNYQPNIGNPRTSKPAIRGLGAGAGTGDGSESDTGFIVDNVFYKHIGFQWADFVDLQSFELALGPAGVTGGKNTTVGDVIIKTQLPSFERKATVETTFANYSHIIEKLNVTGPIVDDKLAYRVAFYLDKGDGWINDAVTGAGLLNNNRWGARGQLLYTGDEITDRLIFNFGTSDETNNSTFGIFGNSFLMYANGTMAATYAATLQTAPGPAHAEHRSLYSDFDQPPKPRRAPARRFERIELAHRTEHAHVDFGLRLLCVASQ